MKRIFRLLFYFTYLVRHIFSHKYSLQTLRH